VPVAGLWNLLDGFVFMMMHSSAVHAQRGWRDHRVVAGSSGRWVGTEALVKDFMEADRTLRDETGGT